MFPPIIHKDNMIIVTSSFDISTVWQIGWHKAVWQFPQEVSQYLGPSGNKFI
jgi:hypothetical protein